MNQKTASNSIIFKGRSKEWFGIWIINILLSIVTLGIYSAWAKVRKNRYFYGNTYIDGDNFEYHATPTQILKGRLIALGVVIIWAVLDSLMPLFAMALLLVFYAVLPWLLWSNARFDSAMTSYRNVHFSFDSSLKDAYRTLMGRGLAALLASLVLLAIVVAVSKVSGVLAVLLGLGAVLVGSALFGWMMSGVYRYFANGYRYGNYQFNAQLNQDFFIKLYPKATATGIASLIAIYIMAAIGALLLSGFMPSVADDVVSLNFANAHYYFFAIYFTVIVLMVGLTAYTATRTRNYIFSQLKLQLEQQPDSVIEFKSSYRVDGYMWLISSNFLLQVMTLGLARPWVMIRTARYAADNTVVIGDLQQLKARDQVSDVKSAMSDEVAQAFDVGIGIS